jgi:uronate dehydrogenase
VELIRATVTDLDAMVRACDGVDAVIHLGGLSKEAAFADILHTNVEGTRNVLEAARRQGVARVVLASSNHAVGFVGRDEAPAAGLPADVVARPDSHYGWGKAAMEALGRFYVDAHGMDVFALRIGSCFETPPDTRGLSTWMSPDDAGRLLEACLTTRSTGYQQVWGVSRNTRRWWSLAEGEQIGYHPVDDAEVFAGTLIAEFGEPDLTDPQHRTVGGVFCDRASISV